MSDVLSAEEVEGFVRRVEARYIDFEAFAALARSHEQMRGQHDKDQRDIRTAMGAAERFRAQAIKDAERADAAEAAARAGGCAADLAEALREITHVATDLPHARRLDRDRMRQIAREALDAYDRAVSGQTKEGQ